MTDPADFRLEAARRVAAMSGLSAAQRKAEQVRIEAQIVAVAEAQQLAEAKAQAAAEAVQERARVADVTAEGERSGRPRQALRLALTGPLTADEARAVLATLPMDRNAPTISLELPSSTGDFGTAGARAERGRVLAILGAPEAGGREATAKSLAFKTDLDRENAIFALASVAKTATYDGPSIEERQRAAGDFGSDPWSARRVPKEERSAEIWKAAVAGGGSSSNA